MDWSLSLCLSLCLGRTHELIFLVQWKHSLWWYGKTGGKLLRIVINNLRKSNASNAGCYTACLRSYKIGLSVWTPSVCVCVYRIELRIIGRHWAITNGFPLSALKKHIPMIKRGVNINPGLTLHLYTYIYPMTIYRIKLPINANGSFQGRFPSQTVNSTRYSW